MALRNFILYCYFLLSTYLFWKLKCDGNSETVKIVLMASYNLYLQILTMLSLFLLNKKQFYN